MPRGKIPRRIEYPPKAVYYKPQGLPLRNLDSVILTMDEYEALRLVDYHRMYHEEAAGKMGVSRATCARILESAHKKLARALSEGMAILIQGGNFEFVRRRLQCRSCGTIWEPETDVGETCPACTADTIIDLGLPGGRGRHGRGWAGGAGRHGR